MAFLSRQGKHRELTNYILKNVFTELIDLQHREHFEVLKIKDISGLSCDIVTNFELGTAQQWNEIIAKGSTALVIVG